MSEPTEDKKEQIIKLLEEDEFSQQEIAQKLQVSPSYVSKIAMSIRIPEEAKAFLTEDEAKFVQEATPTQLRHRITDLMLNRRGVGPGKATSPTVSASEPKPRGGSFLDHLNDELERTLSIQAAAKKLGIEPSSLLSSSIGGGGDGGSIDGMMDRMLADTYKQYRLQWLQRELENLRNPPQPVSALPLQGLPGLQRSVSAEDVKSIVKEAIGTRDAEAEKETLKTQLAELRHRNELLDQFIRDSREREKELAGKPQMDPTTMGQLFEAKTDARIAELEKNILGGKINTLEGKISQLEAAPRGKSFMDVIGEKIEPKLEQKLTEMIEKGFITKEEVVEAKTGKVNWGRVIEKGLGAMEKFMEKAAQGPPPERRILTIPPPGALPPGALLGAPVGTAIGNPIAGYQPPQASSPEAAQATLEAPPVPTNPGGAQTIHLGLGVESVNPATGKATSSERPSEPGLTPGSQSAETQPAGPISQTDSAGSEKPSRKSKPRKAS